MSSPSTAASARTSLITHTYDDHTINLSVWCGVERGEQQQRTQSRQCAQHSLHASTHDLCNTCYTHHTHLHDNIISTSRARQRDALRYHALQHVRRRRARGQVDAPPHLVDVGIRHSCCRQCRRAYRVRTRTSSCALRLSALMRDVRTLRRFESCHERSRSIIDISVRKQCVLNQRAPLRAQSRRRPLRTHTTPSQNATPLHLLVL
jgi:hypothetical protein